MRRTTLTINGLLIAKPDLLDDLQLPAGINRAIAENYVVRTARNFEIVYPDPDELSEAIYYWSSGRLSAWERLYQTELLEYNPIENYNMQESWTDEEAGSESSESSGSSSMEGSSESSGSLDIDKAAFDGTTLKRTESQSTEDETSSESTMTTSDESEGSHQRTMTHTGGRTGNIGVTTSQQMIEQERQIAGFSIYKVIADEFKHEFCLAVY